MNEVSVFLNVVLNVRVRFPPGTQSWLLVQSIINCAMLELVAQYYQQQLMHPCKQDSPCSCRQLHQSVPESKGDTVEGEIFLKIILQLGKHNLPLHVPEDVWGIMAPAVLYPGQIQELYEALESTAPCTWEMMVCPTSLFCRSYLVSF